MQSLLLFTGISAYVGKCALLQHENISWWKGIIPVYGTYNMFKTYYNCLAFVVYEICKAVILFTAIYLLGIFGIARAAELPASVDGVDIANQIMNSEKVMASVLIFYILLVIAIIIYLIIDISLNIRISRKYYNSVFLFPLLMWFFQSIMYFITAFVFEIKKPGFLKE